MKILLGYSYYQAGFNVKYWVESWLKRLRRAGININGFCLTINPPGSYLSWNRLNYLWKKGDRELLTLYNKLGQTLNEYDVFLNWNGINIHPELLRQLGTFNVYSCFDDPESSAFLSRPVAWAYDLVMVGNIAEVDSYRRWGVKRAFYWPHGFRAVDYNPKLTKKDILEGKRPVEISLICDKNSPYRKQRLEKYSKAFPDGQYYGSGWTAGFVPQSRHIPLMQKTKIGPNFHNSTGPINFRTFILPANGVMQICDNKSFLSQIFALNKEVVGFDNVKEAIELTRYYLDHDSERKKIAAAGWERAIREYNEVSVFNRLVEKISDYVRFQ